MVIQRKPKQMYLVTDLATEKSLKLNLTTKTRIQLTCNMVFDLHQFVQNLPNSKQAQYYK